MKSNNFQYITLTCIELNTKQKVWITEQGLLKWKEIESTEQMKLSIQHRMARDINGKQRESGNNNS